MIFAEQMSVEVQVNSSGSQSHSSCTTCCKPRHGLAAWQTCGGGVQAPHAAVIMVTLSSNTVGKLALNFTFLHSGPPCRLEAATSKGVAAAGSSLGGPRSGAVKAAGSSVADVTSAAGKPGGSAAAWDAMNGIAANLLLHLTSSVRFEGTLNTDLNDITMNLVGGAWTGKGLHCQQVCQKTTALNCM